MISARRLKQHIPASIGGHSLPRAGSSLPLQDPTGQARRCKRRGGQCFCKGVFAAARFTSAPTIIEMFGVPGVGKTTLVTAVVQDGYPLTRTELTAAWYRLSRRQQRAFLLPALGNVRCLVCAARFAVRARLTSSDSLVRLVRLIAKTHWMRSHPGEMLLDQSFLQEIWSICVAAERSDPDQVALARFIRCLYAGLETLIVFVEADAAIAAQRISGRKHGYSRLDNLSAADVEARLARTARLPYAIVAAATAAGLLVERLDGADPVEANAARLRTLLVAKSCRQESA